MLVNEHLQEKKNKIICLYLKQPILQATGICGTVRAALPKLGRSGRGQGHAEGMRESGSLLYTITELLSGVSWLCFLPGCQLLSIQYKAVRYRYVWLEYLGCKVHLHGKAQCQADQQRCGSSNAVQSGLIVVLGLMVSHRDSCCAFLWLGKGDWQSLIG